jgi:hypothetical protein
MEPLNPMANNMHVIKSCGIGFERMKHTFHEAFGDFVHEDLRTILLQEADVSPPVDFDSLKP